MLSFHDFKDAVYREVCRITGGELAVKLLTAEKNNGIIKHAITLRGQADAAAPMIFLDGFYDSYLENEKEIEQIAQAVVVKYKEEATRAQLPEDFFLSWDSVKDNIFCRLVNYDANREYLQNVPHERWQNLAVTYYYKVEEHFLPGGTIRIENKHLSVWGVSQEDLAAYAWQNTVEKLPPRFSLLSSVLEDRGVAPDDAASPLWILTNRESFLGATCIAYPGMQERIAEQMGGDYYVLPSSIHEVLIVPAKGFSPEELNALVYNINSTIVDPQEVLSNQVLEYDAIKKELSVVGENKEALDVSLEQPLDASNSAPRM